MSSLDAKQLETLGTYLHSGFQQASNVLATWLDREVSVSLERLDLLSLQAATEELGPADEVRCACCMRFKGGITGQLIFSFDDDSGLVLSDILLNRQSPSKDWGEVEVSAVVETTNILGCALLNALSGIFSRVDEASKIDTSEVEGQVDCVWMPTSPPVFVRDYAAAIMEFVLMDQASATDSVVVARTNFEVNQCSVHWQLLLLPDAKVLDRITRILH